MSELHRTTHHQATGRHGTAPRHPPLLKRLDSWFWKMERKLERNFDRMARTRDGRARGDKDIDWRWPPPGTGGFGA